MLKAFFAKLTMLLRRKTGLSSYALWTTVSPKGDPLTVLEILSFVLICLLAIAFLVVFFNGFHRALHERPTYRMTILRETSLDFDGKQQRVPPRTK
jgi:hypothetical protein